MGIIACDFRKSLYECDSTWEVASVFQAVTNIKTNYKVGDIICIHLTFTSVLSSKSSFKSILRYKITSMSRASSSSGSRRSPYSIFTNVSIWGHIRRLSNLFDWLCFTYISEFCWKNYYNLLYRWALIISSLSFKKKTSHTIRNLTFASVYRWKYYMYLPIPGLALFISVPRERLVDYFDFFFWQLQKYFCIAQVCILPFALI